MARCRGRPGSRSRSPRSGRARARGRRRRQRVRAPASQATGRQRGEGKCPSGNSSSPNVATGATPVIQTQVLTQAASVAQPPLRPLSTASTLDAADDVAQPGPQQDPADRVARPSRRDERADGGEGEHEDRVGDEHGDAVSEGGRELRRHAHDQEPQRPGDGSRGTESSPYRCSHTRPFSAHRGLRSQSETWAGWTVSCTTPRRSAPSASRSSCSRRRAPKASRVSAASYRRR